MNITHEVLSIIDDVLSLQGRTAGFTPETPLLGAIPELDSMASAAPQPALREGFRHLVGYVGIIGMQEGLENLLEAASYIVHTKRRPDVKFAVVGTGPRLEGLIREARALGLAQLADALYWRYLSDEAIHKEQLEMVLDENRELHFEFNDRLMRFAHISPAAEAEARAFLQAW